ncbi:MAG: right-handed parallel beta-helix repeat-containing protein [Anaerolineae bacterium]|nr:right-handed parallel beta-helix repeat-containing protein [Anaerolineae bacterium]
MNLQPLASRIMLVVFALLLATLVSPQPSGLAADALPVYVVAPGGKDAPHSAASQATAFGTLQFALEQVPCGSTIQVQDGRYEEDLDLNRPDCLQSAAPITISGSPAAILVGAGDTYIVEVFTGNITLTGFSIDGEYTPGDYRKKLVYVAAPDVTRLTLSNLVLRNAREECVRLRLNATHNVIMNNRFEYCGRVGGGSTGDNREAIYIGSTASHQPDDQTRFNWIIGNTFNLGLADGTGSECIDIKENAAFNLVEGNHCTHQTSDPESGGINVNGHDNLIVNNRIEDNAGSGIRLGPGSADTEQSGRSNVVMGNIIRYNARFGINALFEPLPAEIALIRGNCIEESGDSRVNRDALKNAATDEACVT